MKNKKLPIQTIALITLTLVILSGCKPKDRKNETTSGEFWKKQTTEQILNPWSENGIEEKRGVFYSYLNREWEPYKKNIIYPGMLARHIYSYASGYMLTGNQEYLEKAKKLKEYLIGNTWDEKYGGWYSSLNKKDSVIDNTKDLFYQIYAATGLTMYYFATKDSAALDYIEKTHQLLEEKAWDSKYKGYYRTLNRDWSVKNDDKSFTPQIAPVSGYLLYLYQTTRKDKYLNKAEDLVNLALDKMNNNKYHYIMENFSRSWEYNYKKKGEDTEINMGHNIEMLWILLRLNDLTGKAEYRQEADKLWETIRKYGYDEENVAWYHRVGLENPSGHTSSIPWWIQAYGNMMTLYYHHISGQENLLQLFNKGAKYWNDHFIDDKYGGAFLSVSIDGSIHKGQKAVRSKTSYHSAEHGFLNYIYSNLWVSKEPVILYYKIQESKKGEKLYPVPVEDTTVRIDKVEVDGETWNKAGASEQYISLPEGKDYEVKVVLKTAK